MKLLKHQKLDKIRNDFPANLNIQFAQGTIHLTFKTRQGLNLHVECFHGSRFYGKTE